MYTISYRQKGLRMRDRTTVHHNLNIHWIMQAATLNFEISSIHINIQT